MTHEFLDAKKREIDAMGAREVEEYRQKVINSLADNPTKFFLYDLIDERLSAINLNNALITNDEALSVDDTEEVER